MSWWETINKFIQETVPVSPENHFPEQYYYPPIEINTDILEDEMIATKSILLEAKEVSYDEDRNIKTKPFCHTV
jgi:hypothetical protein